MVICPHCDDKNASLVLSGIIGLDGVGKIDVYECLTCKTNYAAKVPNE